MSGRSVAGSAPAPWHRALAYALCGTDLPDVPDRPGPDPAVLAEELARQGWDRTTLREHAQQTRQAGRPWPHPVPAELAGDLPAAQFAAVLGAVVTDWGLAPIPRRVRSGSTTRPSAGDERLLRDLPPHFGKL